VEGGKRCFYTVQSAVLIGDGKTEWFKLFCLFVNGLAREIKAVGKGVQVGTESAVVVVR